ncbi:hypothetical protein Aduo_008686 [Ancylostoma duodenale]
MAEGQLDSSAAKHSAEGSAESSHSPAGSAEPEKRSADVQQPDVNPAQLKQDTGTTATPRGEPIDNANIPTAPPIEQGLMGEELTPCSETEWLSSDTAEPAELLNIKKDQRRVTVFAAPVVDVVGDAKRKQSEVTKPKNDGKFYIIERKKQYLR